MVLDHQEEALLETQYVYLIAVLLAILWSKNRNVQFTKRMQRSRKRSSVVIDEQKIIVAIEIQNLFVECSNRKLNGFMPVEVEQGQKTVLQKLKTMFGYGAYYRLLQQRNKIRSFLKNLSALEGIEIYLYTSLHKSLAQKMLKKLGIEDYFPEQHRRYCQEQGVKLNQKKHPSLVDKNTRRVMIVTPNKSDCEDEDRKYFLVLNRLKSTKVLKSALTLIRHIIQKVQSIDDLHTQMDEVKAQIETDYENQEFVTE